jgi:cell division protein FtsQ
LARGKYKQLKKTSYRGSRLRRYKQLIAGLAKYGMYPLLVLGIGYGGIKAYNYIYHLPCFEVSTIQIEGTRVLNDSQIRRLAGLSYQQNIFDVDTELAGQGIESHPYIKEVEVSRRLPNTICIKVKERARFALVKAGGMYVVDEEGIVLEELSGGACPDLPIISVVAKGRIRLGEHNASLGIENGVNILKCLREAQLLGNVSEINVQDTYCPLFYTLREGIEVLLGAGRIEQKLVRMKTVWQDLNARINEVESLDLRFKDMVVVRFKQPKNMV